MANKSMGLAPIVPYRLGTDYFLDRQPSTKDSKALWATKQTCLPLFRDTSMAKGFFSQGVCLLTNGKTTIDDVRSALPKKEWKILKQTKPQKDWQFGGATLFLSFLPEVNGYAAIDVVNQQWPDSMGDPQSDSTTFAAWTMGHFGPLAFPGGLARAGQHSWVWQPGQTIAEGHRGFIRIRISYCFDASDDSPVLPDPYDPVGEMHFLSRVVLAVFNAPGVICYFNSNGEVLRDSTNFREVWTECEEQQKLPLPLWMNIRFFQLNEKLGFMDTVAMASWICKTWKPSFRRRSTTRVTLIITCAM